MRAPVVWLAIAGCLGLLGSATLFAEERVEGDAQDLVFLGPHAPRFFRLHIQIDERGFRTLQAIYAKKLFDSLDADSNGLLNLSEARQIPAPSRYGAKDTEYRLADIDSAPSDGAVSLDELTAYVCAALGTPFRVILQPPRRVEAVNLFARLDADGSGRLTVGELRTSRLALAKFDLDDDETISLAELAAFRNPRSDTLPNVSRTAADLPFVAIATDTKEQLTEELFKRYGSANSCGKGRLSAEEPGISVAGLPAADADSDGSLDRAELVKWLMNPEPQLEVLIRFKQRSLRGVTIVPLTDAEQIRSVGLFLKQIDAKTLSLEMDGLEVRLVAKKNLAAITDFENRQLYRMRFLQADADKNQYVDPEEFRRILLPNTPFEMVDGNADKMVNAEELVGYVDREADLSQSRTTMTVASEGKTLFELLDTDGDGRLVPRELFSADRLLPTLDSDGDGTLAQTELKQRYVLTFEAAQIPVTDRPMMMAADGVANRGPIVKPAAGPLWFRKMDRNRDGDVSPREFLGTTADFSNLDTNEDGLIDVDEATTASPRSDEPNVR